MPNTEGNLRTTVEYAIDSVSECMESHKLTLRPQKYEAVLLAGRRKLTSMTITVENTFCENNIVHQISWSYKDKDMKMTAHLTMITKKTEAAAMSLSKLLPNM